MGVGCQLSSFIISLVHSLSHSPLLSLSRPPAPPLHPHLHKSPCCLAAGEEGGIEDNHKLSFLQLSSHPFCLRILYLCCRQTAPAPGRGQCPQSPCTVPPPCSWPWPAPQSPMHGRSLCMVPIQPTSLVSHSLLGHSYQCTNLLLFLPHEKKRTKKKRGKALCAQFPPPRMATLLERAIHLHTSESLPPSSLKAFRVSSYQPALPLCSHQGHSYLPEHGIHSPASPQSPLSLTHRQRLAVSITPSLFKCSLHKSPGPHTLPDFLFHCRLPHLLCWLPFILTLEAPSTRPV